MNAEVKQLLVGLLIGAVLVLAAVGIWRQSEPASFPRLCKCPCPACQRCLLRVHTGDTGDVQTLAGKVSTK